MISLFLALINYLAQFNIPWFHSWITPIIKITIIIILIIHHDEFKVNVNKEIEGKIKAISISKIKKIIVIKKNCKEKGRREEDFWSNPHSNGESFSRSYKDFLEIIKHNIIIIFAIRKIIKAIDIMFKINYKIIIFIFLIFS